MSGEQFVTTLPIAADTQPSDRVAAMFDAHHQRIYRLARRLTSTADDALDLLQETFLRAAQRPDSVPCGADREEAWLVRVLVNLRRDQWRKAALVRRHHQQIVIDQPTCEPDHGAAVIAQATVWRALDVLPPRRRAVVVMHELEGLAVSRVAALLGISPITVRWHVFTGRRDLARVLMPAKENP